MYWKHKKSYCNIFNFRKVNTSSKRLIKRKIANYNWFAMRCSSDNDTLVVHVLAMCLDCPNYNKKNNQEETRNENKPQTHPYYCITFFVN